MDKKIKASLNKAAQVETRPNTVNLDQMSSEELALLLNQKYSMIIDLQGHIFAINGELQRRQREKLKE